MRRGANRGRGLRPVAGISALTLAFGAALTGCSTPAASLDVPALERLITRHARASYPNLAVRSTQCRTHANRRPFTCRVRTAVGPLLVDVRYAAKGRMRIDAAQAVVPVSAAANLVGSHTSVPGFVNCGTTPTVVATPPDARLTCQVTFEDGTAQSVQLRVVDTAGTLRVETPSAVLAGAAATPGGGVTWTAIGRPVLGHPVAYGGSAGGVGVAWLDPRLLRPVLVSGTGDPPGGPGPWGGQVPPGVRAGLAAAFNSGFKMGDIRGGWVGWGSVWRPPEDGDASLVVKNDGTATVGAWGRDVSMSADVAYVRQNLTLLVDGGAPVAAASNPAAWGNSVTGPLAWRSGLGVDAHGALVYAAGGGLTPLALAQALVAAGAQRAMQLDINPAWVSFNTYQLAPDGGVKGTHVYGATGSDDRYLSPDGRDFVAVLIRPVVDPAASAPVGAAPLQFVAAAPTA